MKKLLTFIAALLLLSGCITNAQDGLTPSKNYITKEFTVDTYNAIVSNALGNIVYTHSTDGKSSAKVYGSDNLVELLTLDVADNTLSINMKEGKRTRKIGKSNLVITLSSPDLCSVNLEGAGNIELAGDMPFDDLTMILRGAGNVKATTLNGKKLTVELEGVGNIELIGQAQRARYVCQGVGNIDASKMEVGHVEASQDGVGNVDCYASESIVAYQNGVGSICFGGHPDQKALHKNGVGKIKEVK